MKSRKCTEFFTISWKTDSYDKLDLVFSTELGFRRSVSSGRNICEIHRFPLKMLFPSRLATKSSKKRSSLSRTAWKSHLGNCKSLRIWTMEILVFLGYSSPSSPYRIWRSSLSQICTWKPIFHCYSHWYIVISMWDLSYTIPHWRILIPRARGNIKSMDSSHVTKCAHN